jgi:hypothetical protein
MGALNLETMNFVYKEFETSIKSENAALISQKIGGGLPRQGSQHKNPGT